MNTTRKFFTRFISTTFSVLSICLVHTAEVTAEETTPITIGLAVCLSGPCALDGQNTINGATIAADEINARGGILGRKIVFAVEDTEDAISGARAITAYYALRNNKKIQIFIGPSWTPGLLALAPVIARDKEVVIIATCGGIKEFHERGSNLFNDRGVDEAGTRALARYAFTTGARTAAVFGSQQAWELAQAEFFQDEFKKAGGEVLISLSPIPTLQDLNSDILKVVSKKPDVVLFGAYTQLDKALKALQTMNYQGKKIVSYIDDSRIRLSGSAIEGAVTIDLLKLSPDLTKRLKERFPSVEPAWSAYTAYDAVVLYKNTIEKIKSFVPAEIAKALPQEKLDGMSGPFDFNGGRLAIRSTDESFKIVQNGKLVTLKN